MAQDPRRGRHNEEPAGGRQALVPADGAALSTMIGAMLIGLSATDAVYRDAAARGIERPALDPTPAPDTAADPNQGAADADAPDHMPFHRAEDPDDMHVAPHPVMEVLPPPPNWDPWTRFDALDTKFVDVADDGPRSSEPSGDAAATAGSSIAASAAAASSTASAAPAAAAPTDSAETIVTSSLTSAQDMIGETMAGLSAAVDHIAASVGEIVQPLTDAVQTTVGQIAGAVEDLGSAIGETVDAVGATIESVTQLAVDLPEAVLGGPEAPAIPDPVFTEAFKPDLPDLGAVQEIVDTGIDTIGSVTEPLNLGFLGQSTMDGMDAHDGAFSIFGSHI